MQGESYSQQYTENTNAIKYILSRAYVHIYLCLSNNLNGIVDFCMIGDDELVGQMLRTYAVELGGCRSIDGEDVVGRGSGMCPFQYYR